MTTDKLPDVADVAPISSDEANSIVLRLNGHGRIQPQRQNGSKSAANLQRIHPKAVSSGIPFQGNQANPGGRPR